MLKKDGRKESREVSAYRREQAVLRVRNGNEKPSEVMHSFGLCRTSIYRWLRAYDKNGIKAIALKKAKGAKPKLTEKQRQQVRRWIVGKDPRQHGFDFGLWTRKIVAKLIKEKFGITLKETAVGRLLASLDITPQKPLRRAYERDEKAVKKWKNEEYPKLKMRAKMQDANIFFLDEAGFSSEPNLSRTYGLKGQTPIVRTSGQRQKVNAISAVNNKGAFWSDVYTGTLTAARFVEFLKKFMRGRTKDVFLVLDGHPSHHAKVVKDYVQNTCGKLELHFLPPYAPDLNPDEFVWQYAKREGVSKKPLRKGESLKSRVSEDMEKIKRSKKLVRSFFNAESVAYSRD